jgi:hypothetical protein
VSAAVDAGRDGTFASQLRAPRGNIVLAGAEGSEAVTIRVQVPEVWDLVRIVASPDTPVKVVKEEALRALFPDHGDPARFHVKLNGFVVPDESAGVAAAGATDGSTFLVTFRRRRPVR